jgi:hypothetical protein
VAAESLGPLIFFTLLGLAILACSLLNCWIEESREVYYDKGKPLKSHKAP